MPSSSSKLPLVLVSSVLALVAAILWWRGRAGSEELFELGPVATATLAFLEQRSLPPDGRGFQWEPYEEATAPILFPHLADPSNRFDPVLGFRYRPGFEKLIEYPEHPAGEWLLTTNGAGLRMDADIASDAPDLRLLVIGDSHTDGICANSEGFPHLLGERLAAVDPVRSVEVLNAGKSGYSFYNYLAAPDAFVDEAPDALVVCVFGGNDFTELLLPHLYQQRLAPPRFQVVRPDVMDLALEHVPPGVLPQGPLQAALIERNPELETLCRAAVLDATRELARRCEKRRLPWGVVYLPPMVDAQRDALEPACAEAEAVLGVGEHGAGAARRIADDLLALLDELDVPTLDLTDAIGAAEERLYWRADHHLNLEGNRVVADALATELLPRLDLP